MSSCAEFSVPLVPPSVNHYKGVNHKTGKFFVREGAVDFKKQVAIFSRGVQVEAESYEISLWFYLGKGHRGDVDNFCKIALDSLVHAGVIESDAKVSDLHVYKRRDWKEPRTHIRITGGAA